MGPADLNSLQTPNLMKRKEFTPPEMHTFPALAAGIWRGKQYYKERFPFPQLKMGSLFYPWFFHGRANSYAAETLIITERRLKR
jgi:hypothetical protein